MKLTFAELQESIGAVKELLTLSPTATVAYAIARNARKINAALEDLNAARAAVVDAYAEGEGDDRRIPEANFDAANAELEELMSTEVDVDIRTITEEMLAECDAKRKDFSVPPSALFGAWFMFEEGSNDEPVA